MQDPQGKWDLKGNEGKSYSDESWEDHNYSIMLLWDTLQKANALVATTS